MTDILSFVFIDIEKIACEMPACMHAKSLQLCLTLCDPMDIICQAPLSRGILQARILKLVASR